jgi:hypothetical protein
MANERLCPPERVIGLFALNGRQVLRRTITNRGIVAARFTIETRVLTLAVM